MDTEALEQMVGTDNLHTVVELFTDVIGASFLSHPMRESKDAEVRRRFGLCMKVFRSLKGDLGWPLPRIVDLLPVYVRCELDGVPWEPSSRRVWLSDG